MKVGNIAKPTEECSFILACGIGCYSEAVYLELSNICITFA